MAFQTVAYIATAGIESTIFSRKPSDRYHALLHRATYQTTTEGRD